MPKLFRAVLIDPTQQTIATVDIDGSLASIKRQVGTDLVDHFRLASFEDGPEEDSFDDGWVDDTGLSRGEPIAAFLLGWRPDPVGGRCLLVGATLEGETCDARFPLDELRSHVTWLGRIRPEVTWDRNGRVERAIVTYARLQS